MLDTEWRGGRSDMEGKAAIIGLRTAVKKRHFAAYFLRRRREAA
jgi:hypothetical protein